MPRKNVRFKNDRGESLAGILDLPDAEPAAFALFAHCFTCSKNLKAAAHISRALVAANIAVLRFDFTGLGQSEGDFADTSFSSNVGDLLAAARYLDEEHAAPQLLLGHSLGGTAVLQAAMEVPSAVAVATIASPSTPTHVAHMFDDSRAELDENGEAIVSLGGRPFRIKRGFLDDLDKHPMPEKIGELRKALLIMHAPLDDIVEIDNASALFVQAKHPKSFVSLDKADHLLTREEDSLYAGRVLAAWASRYLAAAADQDSAAADTDETVARTASGGFLTTLSVGGHDMLADEPLSYGGTNLGPSPYDYLSAALASCTSMTLRMYAEHKKLNFDSATVRVRHNKVHAKDCADCETSSGKIDEFERFVSVEGAMSDEEKSRMLEIADRCPVHKTLHSEVKIRTHAG
jgi:putative redox protein